jgi:hypothetical protein
VSTVRGSDSLGIRRDRPILGVGRGRVVVLAVAVGSVLPIALLRARGDALVEAWCAAQRSPAELAAWRWASFAGSPVLWLVTSVVGFGIASGMNWINASRWMGMLAFGVLWAALADIAVGGEIRGAATLGAVACTLGLWSPRTWPIWAAVALLSATGRLVTKDLEASAALVGMLLGALGPVVIEFGWHAAVPDAPPLRGADLRS